MVLELGSTSLPIVTSDAFRRQVGGIDMCTFSVWFLPPEYAAVGLAGASAFTDRPISESYLDVPGLGLAAWWEPTLGELAVLAGQQTLTVIVVSDSVNPKTAALQIADLALPRLR